jgi:hypothetical protein
LFTLSAFNVASLITTKAISDSVDSTAALMVDFPSAVALLFWWNLRDILMRVISQVPAIWCWVDFL